MTNLIFKEEQSYRGTWLMYLILMLEIPMISLVSFLIWRSEPDKSRAILIIGTFLGVLSLVFFFLMSITLKTRIDPDGVKFRFSPFINNWKTFRKEEIQSIEVVEYSPISDFGGWGLKGNRSTKAYSVLGDQGLLLDIGQKKKVMIGTQKPKELRSYIEEWQKEE